MGRLIVDWLKWKSLAAQENVLNGMLMEWKHSRGGRSSQPTNKLSISLQPSKAKKWSLLVDCGAAGAAQPNISFQFFSLALKWKEWRNVVDCCGCATKPKQFHFSSLSLALKWKRKEKMELPLAAYLIPFHQLFWFGSIPITPKQTIDFISMWIMVPDESLHLYIPE